MDDLQNAAGGQEQRIIEFNLATELNHGMVVSNLAYAVAKELKLPEEELHQIAVAGMLHDIGKLQLSGYIKGMENDPLEIESLK